jgi:ABC-type branched-subunit amino acid transport system substrate-binding protein
MGALLANQEVGNRAHALDMSFDVLLASSPSSGAAHRAGQRLTAVEEVAALVGGLGEGQAEALSAVANEAGVPFFNIGSTSDILRVENRMGDFHIEASAAMYLDAVVAWFVSLGHHSWFVVYEDTDAGSERHRRALESLGRGTAQAVSSAAVAPGKPSYYDEFEAIGSADADVILLLLDPRDQIGFLAQQSSHEPRLPVATFPDPITQTRDYLAAISRYAPTAEAWRRVALWEATLSQDGAGDLNGRFTARWGQPMNPSAWAAYQAINIFFEAISKTGTRDGRAVSDYLVSPGRTFQVGKGEGVSFRSWDHQLRQPLYAIHIDRGSGWENTLSSRLEMADLVGGLPNPDAQGLGVIERLDQLGNGPQDR